MEIEPDQDPFAVGEIADDLLDRFRQTAHERWYRQDLIAASQRRVLHQIDDLQLVAPLEMLFADLFSDS